MNKRSNNISTALLTSALLVTFNSYASNDEWDEWETESEHLVSVSGFTQGKLGYFLDNNNQSSHASAQHGLLRLEALLDQSFYHVSVKTDSTYDVIANKWHNDVREMNINIDFANVEHPIISQSLLANMSINIGRQSLSWGLGDFVFINDLFAKDWQSFFNGDDLQYLKKTSDAIKLSYFMDAVSVDIVYLPTTTTDELVQPLNGIITPNHSSLHSRLYFSHQQSDYALYASDTWTNVPMLINGRMEYLAQKSIGASMITPLASGLLKTEIAQYWQTSSQGSELKQRRLLVGFEWELLPRLAIATQAYIERDDTYFEQHNRQLLTTQFTYTSTDATWTNQIMAFYSPNHHDNYLRATSTYRHNDDISITAGLNNLDGKPNSFFGSLSNIDNAYLRFTYYF